MEYGSRIHQAAGFFCYNRELGRGLVLHYLTEADNSVRGCTFPQGTQMTLYDWPCVDRHASQYLLLLFTLPQGLSWIGEVDPKLGVV